MFFQAPFKETKGSTLTIPSLELSGIMLVFST